MTFNRRSPSPRYSALVELHRQAHQDLSQFPGYSIGPFIGLIKTLIDETGCRTALDYGCGAGHQYTKVGVRLAGSLKVIFSLAKYWGVTVTRFDPAIPRYARLPAGPFDAVVCTDVLEHIAEPDVAWTLRELFSHAGKLVFINVASFPAQRSFADGTNTHATVKDSGWWQQQVADVAGEFPSARYCLVVTARGRPWTEQVYSNRPLPALTESAHLFPLWGGWGYFLRKKVTYVVRRWVARIGPPRSAHSA